VNPLGAETGTKRVLRVNSHTASPTVMIAEKGATAVIEDRQAGARPA
jgi:RNA-binding protein YhbY